MSAAVLSDAITPTAIDDIDKSLEAATLLRASEAGYARDYRRGSAFGLDGDRERLDAFTVGLLDALALRIGQHDTTLKLLSYLHALLDHGPGQEARDAWRKMLNLKNSNEYASYMAGGRRQVLQVLNGKRPRIGLFAELLAQESEQRQLGEFNGQSQS